MMEEGNEVSIAALCRWFGVPRSSFYYRPRARSARPCNPERVGLVRQIIDANPLSMGFAESFRWLGGGRWNL
jgi:putative transposase